MENPATGKEDEQVITDFFIQERKEKIKALEKKLVKPRNTLFWVAAITLVIGLLQLKQNGYSYGKELNYTLFISVVFLALGFLTKKEPFMALVIALIIYVGLWLLTIIAGGEAYIFKGLIAKLVIIFFIGSGIPHARQAEELKKELKAMEGR